MHRDEIKAIFDKSTAICDRQLDRSAAGGFETPTQCCQSGLIRAWYSKKAGARVHAGT